MFAPCINDIQIFYYPTNAQYIILSVRKEEIGYNRKDFRENLYLSVFLKNFMFSPCINDIQILYYPTNAQYIVLSVRMEDIGYNRKDFRENLYLSVFF